MPGPVRSRPSTTPLPADAGAGRGPAAPVTGSSAPRATASRCSRMRRSGQYRARCSVTAERSRSTSAWLNLRYPDAVRAGSTRPSVSQSRILEMLTSGKSGVSRASTSPMLMDWSRRETAGLTCGPRGVVSPAGDVAGASLGGTLGTALRGRPDSSDVDDEPELADLDLVAGDDGARVDALAVDVRAVEAADVADGEGALLADELGVLARHRDV